MGRPGTAAAIKKQFSARDTTETGVLIVLSIGNKDLAPRYGVKSVKLTLVQFSLAAYRLFHSGGLTGFIARPK